MHRAQMLERAKLKGVRTRFRESHADPSSIWYQHVAKLTGGMCRYWMKQLILINIHAFGRSQEEPDRDRRHRMRRDVKEMARGQEEKVSGLEMDQHEASHFL